ncbi:MAG: murein transglycosylase A [Sphingopyxis sp.]|nr:murein transglycosylase A [Sphingopyxis sp.]
MRPGGRPSARHRAACGGVALALLVGCNVIPGGVARPVPASAGPAAQPVPATPNAPLPAAPAPADALTAAAAGVIAGPAVTDLGLVPANARLALTAFRISCRSVLRRADTSGLTQPGDWAAACSAATGWRDDDAIGFFATHFAAVQVGDGKAFATGYFEPEILASRVRQPGFEVPVYRRPSDLIEVELGDFATDLAGRKLRGRIDGARLVRYHDRTAIDVGALAGRGLEIAWAADAGEFFFLQIQGSGRLRLPDGQVIRIGYDTQNGHDYVGIGRLLRERGALQPGQTSMQGILDYLRADPVRGAAVMRENPSWVFFRELTGPGPLGALGLPVTPRASVATDPKFVPLGAPIFLSMDRAEPNGLWIAQDTGGAIKGANRVDTFWGAGPEARAIAGGMAARGSALLLLPKASAARLMAKP